MAVKITLPDGTKIEADTAKEAGEAHREFVASRSGVVTAPVEPRSKYSIHIRRQRDQQQSLPIEQANGFSLEQSTLHVLEAIKAAGSRGIPGDKMQEILHVKHPKGIGSRMAMIRDYLRKLGFEDAESLFVNPKDRSIGGRVWKPRQQIDNAITEARKALQG